MFTGIVQSQGEVYSIETENNLSRLVVKVDAYLIEALTLGASIAVNGVCLTVVSFKLFQDPIQQDKALISFDVIDETLAISNLALLSVSAFVNIERSLKMGDELGGHIVSGHVHCKAKLVERLVTKTNCCLRFSLDNKWKKYILAKGFISINGISLTVGDVSKDYFSVHLIPETLARTNLSQLKELDEVNIECDQQTITIVTTIERMKL